MLKRRKTLLLSVLAALVAGLISVVVLMGYLEKKGNQFFERGHSAVMVLDQLSAALRSGNPAAIEGLYSEKFHGKSLGLRTLDAGASKDGIRERRFLSDGAAADRKAAIDEWRQYLDGFTSIEELGLHVFRVEDWSSADRIVARVRFETIGTPQGATLAAIDRGYFRMAFERTAYGLKIADAALLEGSRIDGEAPQFVNVAHDAGVDFQNRYYPHFLDQPLKFGMIRYGPGGMSAVDYDNDGNYDLFIPDGVEAKLFRNKGDGTFEDVTSGAGLGGLDGVGVGVFADFDNDGQKDLFVGRTFQHNQLFHNNGNGTFTDVTAKSGIGEDSCTTVASWGDYDNDGRIDLYVGRYMDPRLGIPTTFYARNGLPNQLYHNNGDGTFTNVTIQAGVGDTGLCLGTVWGDYDGDGFPDLYVVNDFGRKTLYHNERNGTFKDVSVASGTLDYGAGMSASFGDYNNDGKLDIYVANILSEEAWFAEWPTVGRYMTNCWKQGVWKSDMPLYWQIFRQSGLGFVGVFQQMASGNTLLRNRGDGTFEDVTTKAHAAPVGWFWGSNFGDLDNDGWLDIYSVNGWVYNDKGTEIELDFLNGVVSEQQKYKTGIFFDPKHFGKMSWHGWERNRHLRNNGDGTFTEIGRAAGDDLLLNSRGLAFADFWNRGVLDMAVSASTDRHALLKNQFAGRRHWLEVELTGTKSNRDAVGARVTIKIGNREQMREVVLGDGYGSQNSLRQHFGLADSASVDELIVKWPRSGIIQTFKKVAADQIVQINEESDSLGVRALADSKK